MDARKKDQKSAKMERKWSPNGANIAQKSMKKGEQNKDRFWKASRWNRSTAGPPETPTIQQDTLQGNLHLNQHY